MKVIYKTKEWKGYGKQNYYWNEYRQDKKVIEKYKCNRVKSFDGKENTWVNSDKLIESWDIKDPEIPSWLKQYIK